MKCILLSGDHTSAQYNWCSLTVSSKEDSVYHAAVIQFQHYFTNLYMYYTIDGGVFDTAKEVSVFRAAVELVNRKGIIGRNITVDYVTNVTGALDAFNNIRSACWMVEQGVMTFVGPMTSTATRAVSPVSGALKIPQLAPAATDPNLSKRSRYPYVMQMTPSDSVQSLALAHLINHFGWKRMAILAENTDYGLNGMLEFQAEALKRNWRIISVLAFSLPKSNSSVNAREQLLVIRRSGVRVVILNCLRGFADHVLLQARDLGMLTSGWAWVVTDGTTALESDSGSQASYWRGLIGTRPVSPEGALWQEFNTLWNSLDPTIYPGAGTELDIYTPRIVDSVLLFAYAARDLYAQANNSAVLGESLNCETGKDAPWAYGERMRRALLKAEGPGLSGYLKLSQGALPLHPKYDIVNYQETGWTKVGSWTPDQGLHLADKHSIQLLGGQQTVYDYVSQLSNKVLRAVTIAEPPFVMLAEGVNYGDEIAPNQTEGFVVDLFNKLAEQAGFNYTLYVVPDGNFGAKNPVTGKWNGVVKELIDGKADVAVVSLTINHAREQDIDMTKPYLDLGMKFVMKVPTPEPVRPFRFLDPFSMEVWLYVLGAMFVVGLHISLLNKLSPYGHHGQFVHQHHEEVTRVRKLNVLSNFKEMRLVNRRKTHAFKEMNTGNATWFSLASLLQQGGEVYPRSLAGQTTTVIWWFCIVIIISTYTANLAAFLTASRTKTTINSVEDLGTQTNILYGTVSSSAPHQFFLDSGITLYRDMIGTMNARNTLVKSTKAGIERVRTEDYAFIWDSAVLDYVVEQKPCGTLRTVGRLFGKIGYGFGLQKGSPLRDEFSVHILQLREIGFIDDLKKKWYQKRSECYLETHTKSETEKAIEEAGGQLTTDHMLGVFMIIYAGMVMGVIILVMEWVVACRTAVDVDDPTKPKSFMDALKKKLGLTWRHIRTDSLPHLWGCNKPVEKTDKNETAPAPPPVTKRRLGWVAKSVTKNKPAENGTSGVSTESINTTYLPSSP